MEISGDYTFNAPREFVWDILQDPEVIGSIIPGSSGLEEIAENKYTSTIVVKVGPVGGSFKAEIELADIKPPDSYKLILNSNSPVGYVAGEGAVRLEQTGDVTTMFYSGNAKVGGKIAAVGQRLLDVAAKFITKQSLDGLAKRIEDRINAENPAAN
jgi:hypothetical protein